MIWGAEKLQDLQSEGLRTRRSKSVNSFQSKGSRRPGSQFNTHQRANLCLCSFCSICAFEGLDEGHIGWEYALPRPPIQIPTSFRMALTDTVKNSIYLNIWVSDQGDTWNPLIISIFLSFSASFLITNLGKCSSETGAQMIRNVPKKENRRGANSGHGRKGGQVLGSWTSSQDRWLTPQRLFQPVLGARSAYTHTS